MNQPDNQPATQPIISSNLSQSGPMASPKVKQNGDITNAAHPPYLSDHHWYGSHNLCGISIA